MGVLRALAEMPEQFAEVALLLVNDEEFRTEPFAHGPRFAHFDACLCFEGGERTADREEAVVVRRKAAAAIRVEATGVAAHAGAQPDAGPQCPARAREGRDHRWPRATTPAEARR